MMELNNEPNDIETFYHACSKVELDSDSMMLSLASNTASEKDRAVLDHPENTSAESSQAPMFAETQNIQVPCPASSCGVVSGEELHLETCCTLLPTTTDDSFRIQIDTSQHDLEMEAFYASLDGGTHVLSRFQGRVATNTQSEEAREALKIVQDFITDNDASVLLDPEQYNIMKTSLDYLSNLSVDDSISGEMRALISQASTVFTHWRRGYIEASMKVDSTASKLQRADELEAGLEANKNQFREVVALENELLQKLARLRESKQKLEEQMDAIKADILTSQSEQNRTREKKRDIFEEGKTFKTQMDKLKGKVGQWQYEQDLAKETKAKIKAEWLEFGKKFKWLL